MSIKDRLSAYDTQIAVISGATGVGAICALAAAATVLFTGTMPRPADIHELSAAPASQSSTQGDCPAVRLRNDGRTLPQGCVFTPPAP